MALIKNKIFIGRIILSGICLLFLATTFHTENRSSDWYQQYLPSGINNNINNLLFTDSLTGYIATASDNNGNGYILRTTNGGVNWNIFFQNWNLGGFQCLQFLNKDSAIVGDAELLYKTTDAGISWVTKPIPWPGNMFALNFDTIFIADDQSVIGGLWRTTNSGSSWNKLVNFGDCNPEKIYCFNKYNGYMAKCNELWKSTDCGSSWFYLASGNWLDIHFLDSLNGYKADGGVRKTTDGGYNWIQQQMPNIIENGVGNIELINRDTIWGVGGTVLKNGKAYGVVYKTTNDGNNWGYQIPLDTNTIAQYYRLNSINKFYIWSYYFNLTGVHSKIGGSDTTFFTGLTLYSNIVPEKFSLGQNYPNPFNPVTKIPYEIKEPGYIVLKVYDITGRMVKELVNGNWGTAKYIADFDASGLSSGIYFYRIEITGLTSTDKFTDSKKMLLIK
jgi:photosystem II stability/assembly factor-like uncharacterized protein